MILVMNKEQNSRAPVDRRVMLPCPFCGGDAATDENIYNSVKPNDWYAYCGTCMIGFTRKTKELAINAWNTRAA